jgi:hypothetical protein
MLTSNSSIACGSWRAGSVNLSERPLANRTVATIGLGDNYPRVNNSVLQTAAAVVAVGTAL